MNRRLSAALIAAAGLVSSLAGGVIYFLAAGRWDLPMGWATTAVLGAAGLGMGGMDPSLLKERHRPGPGARDRFLLYASRPLAVGAIVIAGLDVGRYHWSDNVPFAVQVGGLVVFGLGMGLALWAVWVNRFFSAVIRLQEDRGHHLITDGPYRFVRHPGYAGILPGMPCMMLALGSWWSLAPMLVFAALILRRAWLEDRFLHEHLAGYPDYARRVRYRLLPGVW